MTRVLALTLAVWLAAAPPCPAGEWETIPARCAGSVDGDDLLLDVGGLEVRVRLRGIDAPEWDQPWGEAAKKRLADICRTNPEMRLEKNPARGHYGRCLGWVWAGDELVNAELVRAGLALPYGPGDDRHRELIDSALDQAKTSRAGFWSEGGLAYTPREWRKLRRAERESN